MIEDTATDIGTGVLGLPDVDRVALVQDPSTTIPGSAQELCPMTR